MQNTFKLAAVAALCSAALAAHAGVAFDANIETNTDFHKKTATTDNVTNGGRVEVNANAEVMKNGDFFVNAKGTVGLQLNNNSTTDGNQTYVDDAWVQAGNSAFDVKVGRFEAPDLFPLGRDIASNIAVGYNGNQLRGRVKDGRLHAAFGANLGSSLRVEMGLITEKQTGSSSYGLRPIVRYSAGPLTIAAGIEAIKADGTGKSATGFATTLGYALSETMSFNVNYANKNKTKENSFGLNANIGNAGVGFVQSKNDVANTKSTSLYASYAFPLFGVKGATITPALGVTKVTGSSSDNAFRVRINYAF
jgi:hypothetical protein